MGSDEITSGLDDYVRKAHRNAATVLNTGGVWVRILRDLDKAFSVASGTLKPTKGTVVGAFITASHSSWLAAANLTLSAHLAESFQPLRACLESAFYGYRVRTDRDAWERWSRRPTAARLKRPGEDQTALMRERKENWSRV